MIKKSTVLILGAGASLHMGFPLGEDFIKSIIGVCSPIAVLETVNRLAPAGYGQQQIIDFSRELSRSHSLSIDSFLALRTDLEPIGRALIAFTISQMEKPKSGLTFSHSSINWYKKLADSICGRFEDIPKTPLAIITFNYERSLEWYLINAIESRYAVGHDQAECRKAFNNIPIIHVHGSLGSYENRQYGHKDNIREAADSIRVIHQSALTNTECKKAKSYIDDYDTAIFLGFGYGEDNLKHLGFPRDKRVFGTAVNLSPKKRGDAVKAIGTITWHDGDIQSLLDNHL